MSKLRRRFKQEFGNPPLDYDGSSSVSRLGNHWGTTLQNKLEELQVIAEYNNLSGVWWDHIDPELSQEENVDILLDYAENGLPPELDGKYEGDYQRRQKRYEAFQKSQEKQEPDSRSKDRREMPSDDIELKTLGEHAKTTEQ